MIRSSIYHQVDAASTATDTTFLFHTYYLRSSWRRCRRRAHTPLASNTRHRRRITRRLGREPNIRRRRRRRHSLRLDQNRDDLPRLERKLAVPQHLQQSANLTRVTADSQPCGVIVGENVVQRQLAASQLVLRRLALRSPPQLVLLCEAFLKCEARGRKLVNLRLGGAAVAGMDADAFAQVLLDCWRKRVLGRERQVAKRRVGGQNATGERRAVVGLKVGHALVLVSRLVVCTGLVGVTVAGRRQERISPDRRAVAIFLCPVALDLSVRDGMCLMRGGD